MKLLVEALKGVAPRLFWPVGLATALVVGMLAGHFFGDDSVIEEIAEEVVISLLDIDDFEFDFSPASREQVHRMVHEKADEIAKEKNLKTLSNAVIDRIIVRAEEKLTPSD